jgi:hypothetical protein
MTTLALCTVLLIIGNAHKIKVSLDMVNVPQEMYHGHSSGHGKTHDKGIC